MSRRISVVTVLTALGLALSATGVTAGTKVVNGTEVRDRETVDTNKDGSISPEEMEKFLQATWAQNKSK